MTIDRIKKSLVALKMARALEMLDVTLRKIEQGEINSIEALDHLLVEELTLRENRRVKAAFMWARLSAIKPLPGFDRLIASTTRLPSRAYKKNDRAYVEQKNGAIVRRLMGCGRF